MLDDEVLDVLLVDVFLRESGAAVELVLEPECIHDGDDAVEVRHAVLCDFRCHSCHRADGLCDGFRFADAACFDDDVVELLECDDVIELLHEVHLECAADASVLQGDEAVVLSPDDASLLYEVGVDVHFPQVVDDNGKAYAATVCEDAVQKCCLAAAQITCEQQHRNVIFHSCKLIIDCKVTKK